jgi:uncharacterized protein (TIGR01777 family)
MRNSFPLSVRVYAWDAESQGVWVAAVNAADAVVNLAGESLASKRWSPGQKLEVRSSRVHATRALVDAIRLVSHKPSVLISASAVGYYGDTGSQEVTEETPPGKGFLPEVCEAWETEALRAREFGARVVLLRTGVVLGDRGGALERMVTPFQLLLGGPLGSGNQWFPWVHRDDVVGVILFAAEQDGLEGPVNLAAPEAVTMRQFCRTLGAVMRRPSWLRVPSFLLQFVLGEMSIVVLGGQKITSGKLIRSGYQFKFDHLRPALADILRRYGG